MDVRQFLAQFDEGEITVEEVGRGMHVSFLNARSLVEDAELLLERRPARALSLAVLAMEETAKIFTLCTAAAMAYDGSVEWARARRKLDLLSHEAKQAVFAGYGRALLETLLDKEPGTFYECEVPVGLIPLLNRFKQMGFYVDCFKGRFVCPEDDADNRAEWARWLLQAVKQRLASAESMHCTEEASRGVAEKAASLARAAATAGSQEAAVEALKVEIKRLWTNDEGAG